MGEGTAELCVAAGSQEKYSFKAHDFHAAGFASREEYRAQHGSDLYLVDIELYDQICKVSSQALFHVWQAAAGVGPHPAACIAEDSVTC